MAVLDDLSGLEFEGLMEDVFRNLGYEDVQQSVQTGDEGRDILMEEVIDGVRRAVVVECKHTSSVGRPVVQKLHSAVSTYEYNGPKRGIVVTTGRFTDPAKEYANRLRQNNDPYPIELIDGQDLREIADEVGLDLYNGRIEILCDETLRPYDPSAPVTAPVNEEFRDIENIETAEANDLHSKVIFRPMVSIITETHAIFETSVGVIHEVHDQSHLSFHADRDDMLGADIDVAELIDENIHNTVELDPAKFRSSYDDVVKHRFGHTQTAYKNRAVDWLRDYHTTTVTYTGANNVTYNKTCEPNLSDISVQSVDPVYLPEIHMTTRLGEYSYPYEYYAAGPSRVTIEDGIHRCVHCDKAGTDNTYTYCANCGAIACHLHIRTERLEQTPICTDCAVTERFALKTKYFYSAENLEAFREEYAAMPIHRKAMENKPLVGGGFVATLLVIVGLLVVGGVI